VLGVKRQVEKIPIRQVILCEGKYDVIRLSTLFDALILPTHGFQLYRNADRRELFKRLAAQRGLVIVTDSDHAGFQIRAYLKSFIPAGQLIHVYIPDIQGKERRKDMPSSEGKLGVEGMDTQALLDAFKRAGVIGGSAIDAVYETPITKLTLYQDGFSGTPGAKARYKALLKTLGLPEHLSTNLFCAVVGEEEYKKAKQQSCG